MQELINESCGYENKIETKDVLEVQAEIAKLKFWTFKYDKVLDKYELKKEVMNYLPKIYMGQKRFYSSRVNLPLVTSKNLIFKSLWGPYLDLNNNDLDVPTTHNHNYLLKIDTFKEYIFSFWEFLTNLNHFKKYPNQMDLDSHCWIKHH